MQTKAEILKLNQSSYHEAAEDFTLPDYLPEIRRIVSCTGAVLPESRYLDRGEIVLSGLAVATVYYIGDDGALCAFPQSSEYSGRLPMTGSDTSGLSAEGMVVKTSLESVSCRATGPRRLTLTYKLRSSVFASRCDELNFTLESSAGGECNVSDELSLEKRSLPFTYTSLGNAFSTGSVSGELHEREGTRIISCEGTAAVSSATLNGSEVTLKGEVFVNCLAVDAEGAYNTLRTKAPFEERLHVKDVSADCIKSYAAGRVRCASVKLHGGEGGVFPWEAEYDAEAVILSDREGSLTDDVYSTAYLTNNTEDRAHIVKCLGTAASRLTVNGTKQIAPDGKEIVFFTAKAAADRTECTAEGKLVISGSCTVCAVLADGVDTVTEELTLPYRYECDAQKHEGSEVSVICDVCVIGTDGRVEGDRLSVNCELAISAVALSCTEKTYVCKSVLCRDEPVGLDEAQIKLYFPERGESEWDIGKRYHCPMKCISRLDGERSVIITK